MGKGHPYLQVEHNCTQNLKSYISRCHVSIKTDTNTMLFDCFILLCNIFSLCLFEAVTLALFVVSHTKNLEKSRRKQQLSLSLSLSNVMPNNQIFILDGCSVAKCCLPGDSINTIYNFLLVDYALLVCHYFFLFGQRDKYKKTCTYSACGARVELNGGV